MNEKVLKCLYDIKLAIEEIDSFFIDTEKSYDSYIKDIRLRRAIERNLEIIGEAVNRIITRDKSFTEKISNAKAIIGLRN